MSTTLLQHEGKTYEDILTASSQWRVLEVQRHQMLRELAIQNLVDVVQHQVQQVETGDQRRWEVDVLRHGLFWIVLRPNGIRCG